MRCLLSKLGFVIASFSRKEDMGNVKELNIICFRK